MNFLSKVFALTDMSGDAVDNSMLLSELNSIEHHIDEIRSHLSLNELAPDWVKSKISVAADELSDIAHFIMGLKAGETESPDEDDYEPADDEYDEKEKEEEEE